MDYEELNKELKAVSDDSTKHLTFLAGGQVFGISVSNVIEVVQLEPAVGVPEMPPYIKGIINLGGQIVKLIDVNLRFGYEKSEYTERSCVVILDFDGKRVGFIVDEVKDMLYLDDTMIFPPVSSDSEESSRYITGICKVDGYIVLLLNCLLLSGVDYSNA